MKKELQFSVLLNGKWKFEWARKDQLRTEPYQLDHSVKKSYKFASNKVSNFYRTFDKTIKPLNSVQMVVIMKHWSQLISDIKANSVIDYTLYRCFVKSKQGYTLKNWVEGLSDEAYYPVSHQKNRSTLHLSTNKRMFWFIDKS